MDVVRFYRLDEWYPNLGIALIGVLSSGVVDPALAAVVLLQVSLLHMYAFSLNDFFDQRFWAEQNYLRRLVEGGRSQRFLLVLCLLPLVVVALLSPISGGVAYLLVGVGLPYIYDGPPFRLKDHYLVSILVNSAGMGALLYVGPYMMMGGSATSALFWFFSGLFFLYMAFYEVAHQVEHGAEDAREAITDALSPAAAVTAVRGILGAAFVLSLVFLVTDAGHAAVYLTAAGFTLYRLHETRSLAAERLSTVRRSWHKFYSAFEGAVYLVVLAALQVGLSG